MPTKRQQRAKMRIQGAKRRKEYRFQEFLVKLAMRRLGPGNNDEPPRMGFCCMPSRLGMSIADFMATGMLLVGGRAALFGMGKLPEILGDWGCSSARYPHMFTIEYLRSNYHSNGERKPNW